MEKIIKSVTVMTEQMGGGGFLRKRRPASVRVAHSQG